MRRIIKVIVSIFLSFVISLSLSVGVMASGAETSIEDWTNDIKVLANKVNSIYFAMEGLKVGTTKESFNKYCDDIIQSLPDLTQDGRYYELTKAVSMLKDGHANVYRENYQFYPLKFYWLDDGLYLITTTQDYKKALNMKLIGVGQNTLEEAMSILDPFISYDNLSWKKHTLWYYLTDAGLLSYTGIASSPNDCVFTFADDQGKTFEFLAKPISSSEKITWMRDPEYESRLEKNPPLWMSGKGYYFFVPVTEKQTMYVYYGKCIEDPKYPFTTFMEDLKKAWTKSTFSKLILDMRFNSGGGTPLLFPLVNWVKNNEDLRLPGSFFVLIGKRTFSAAVQNVSLMYKDTVATFVGEPTGQKPNHWGQVIETKLEKTGLSLYSSSRYMKIMEEDPDALYPDTEIQWNHNDYFNGRDTVVEAILDSKVPATKRNVFVRPSRIDAWTQDIRQIEANIMLKYPKLTSKIDKSTLHEQFTELLASMQKLDDVDMFLEINRILRVLDNPYLYFSTPLIQSFDYHIMAQPLGDGLYFVFADKANEAIVGKKIVGIGNCSMEEVDAKLSKYFCYQDFGFFVQNSFLWNLNSLILSKLGILKDTKLSVKVENQDGKIEEHEVKKFITENVKNGFVAIPNYKGKIKPLYKKYNQGIWTHYLPDDKIFYMKVDFASIPYDRKEYAIKIIEEIKSKNVKKIVLDYRMTGSMYVGFSPKNIPFYQELANFINESGKYKSYVLVEKVCQSNYVYEAAFMKHKAGSIIVGDTPAVKPVNMYTCFFDKTPNKDITFGVPIEKFDSEGFIGEKSLEPDVKIVVTGDNYINATDPVMDWIIAQ